MQQIEKTVKARSDCSPQSIPADVLVSQEPVVLRGLAAQWPSVRAGKQGPDSLLDYLSPFCVNKNILAFRASSDSDGRIFYNEDMDGFNFDRITSTLETLFTQWRQQADDSGDCLYLGSTNVDTFLPGFRADNDIELSDVSPLVSIWMGNRSRIAAHFDTPNNIACALSGRRRFTLFPPDQLANLYVGPIDFTPAGQAISLVDFADPDFDRFPRFKQALDVAQTVELEPGDALFIPSMWWHHVESLDAFNVLVNYWWQSTETVADNPLNALIHALMSIKSLPPSERAAWQGMFEHYVFGDSTDVLSHIPPARHGVLGELDAETMRGLRKMLSNKLQG